MAKPRLGQSRQKPRAKVPSKAHSNESAKPRAKKGKPAKTGIIAEKNVSELVAAMRSFGLDEGAVLASLFGSGLSLATRKGYSNAVRRVDRIAIAYGFPNGMRDRCVFLRYLLANVQLGIARGNSTMNHVRCALAHRQEMEGEEEWANSALVKKAVARHDTAGKRATVQQVASGAIPPAVVRGAVTADLLEKVILHLQPPEAALVARLQFYGCLRPGEVFVLLCSCLTKNDTGDDAIIILSNKALRPANARRTAAFQTRPISSARSWCSRRHSRRRGLRAEQAATSCSAFRTRSTRPTSHRQCQRFQTNGQCHCRSRTITPASASFLTACGTSAWPTPHPRLPRRVSPSRTL
jgi:hypothetical protein